MSSSLLFASCGMALVGLGAYGFIAYAHLLRRILAFNVAGSGVFLAFGGFAHRAPAIGADPVPHAMVITGIVVALAATAFAIALALRLFEETGAVALPGEVDSGDPDPD